MFDRDHPGRTERIDAAATAGNFACFELERRQAIRQAWNYDRLGMPCAEPVT